MGIKIYKPTSPGRRGAMVDDFQDITRSKPHKGLTSGTSKNAGRNNTGRITVRHRGGGHKRLYRSIDFTRTLNGEATVQSIEYDPNRNARIALVRYDSGIKRYIIAPNRLCVGNTVSRTEAGVPTIGNVSRLSKIPLGTLVHAVELTPGKGAKLVRSAGTSAQIMAHEGKYTLLRMPSGETRYVLSDCSSTIGTVSHQDHKNIKLGKAGRVRHLGRRPQVRGSAMSPRAHPHGGGEGRSPIGLKSPKTPWGKPAQGYRTRKNKATTKHILRRRNQK